MHSGATSAHLPILTVIATIVAVVLSACVDSPTDPFATPAATEGATLRGVVVSDEVFPVSGANVSIEDGPSTFTDDEGRFTFTGLQPGTLTLNVRAEGYEAGTQDVTVRDGDAVEILITIAGVAGEAPFLQTVIFEGFAACTLSAVYAAGPYPPSSVPCPFGDRQTGTSVEVEENWRAGVHEVTWATDEEMIVASSLESNCQTSGDTVGASHCPYLGWGKPPIRIFARINDTDYAEQYAIDGKATWHAGAHESFVFASYSGFFREEINQTAYPVCVQINRQFSVPEHWGCPFGVGYSIGLRFTIYHTTFYNQEPIDLEAFTAIPDQ